MNEIDRDLRRSVGLTPDRTLHRIVQRTGHLVTQGQLETAGKAYTRATVWTAAAHAVIDGIRMVGRTVWKLATVAAVGFAGVWLYLHWGQLMRWMQ